MPHAATKMAPGREGQPARTTATSRQRILEGPLTLVNTDAGPNDPGRPIGQLRDSFGRSCAVRSTRLGGGKCACPKTASAPGRPSPPPAALQVRAMVRLTDEGSDVDSGVTHRKS